MNVLDVVYGHNKEAITVWCPNCHEMIYERKEFFSHSRNYRTSDSECLKLGE